MNKTKKSISVKNDIPFGSAKERFSLGLGMHPGFMTAGGLNNPLAPGQYYVKEISCSYKSYAKESWRKKLALEEWSKNIGYTHPDELENRSFMRSMRGPGSYSINEDIFRKQSCNVSDSLFGRQKRFYDPLRNFNPPPGTYTGEWVNKPLTIRKHETKTPTFEWDGLADRFKTQSKPWMIPPNVYNAKDGRGIEDLLKKKVSERGPYDLFTGPRDETTIKNYFSSPKLKGPEEYFRYFPSYLEIMLTSPDKSRYGKFFQAKRWNVRPTQRNIITDPVLCWRDPKSPGPGHYKIPRQMSRKHNKYAFNMCTKEAKPGIKWRILPGVGRYNPKLPRCMKHKQKSWVFKSKIGRPEFKAPDYTAF